MGRGGAIYPGREGGGGGGEGRSDGLSLQCAGTVIVGGGRGGRGGKEG